MGKIDFMDFVKEENKELVEFICQNMTNKEICPSDVEIILFWAKKFNKKKEYILVNGIKCPAGEKEPPPNNTRVYCFYPNYQEIEEEWYDYDGEREKMMVKNRLIYTNWEDAAARMNAMITFQEEIE